MKKSLLILVVMHMKDQVQIHEMHFMLHPPVTKALKSHMSGYINAYVQHDILYPVVRLVERRCWTSFLNLFEGIAMKGDHA